MNTAPGATPFGRMRKKPRKGRANRASVPIMRYKMQHYSNAKFRAYFLLTKLQVDKTIVYDRIS